jgi:hypothetical protein
MRGAGSERLTDAKAASTFGHDANFDTSAVRRTNSFDDGKTQTGAALIARAGTIDAKEALKHMRQSFGRYTYTVIHHVQDRVAILARDL